MKDIRRIEILKCVDNNSKWPEGSNKKEQQALITTGFAFEERDEVILTSLGELEVGYESFEPSWATK
jgi:hypothetical protein